MKLDKLPSKTPVALFSSPFQLLWEGKDEARSTALECLSPLEDSISPVLKRITLKIFEGSLEHALI